MARSCGQGSRGPMPRNAPSKGHAMAEKSHRTIILLLLLIYCIHQTNSSLLDDPETIKTHNSIIKTKADKLGHMFKNQAELLNRNINKELDLVFLVDASASVGSSNFESELKFVRKLLADFTVSINTTRVAVVTYSSKVVRIVDQISAPHAKHHKCSLLESLSKAVYYGGSTYTLGALREAQDILSLSRRGARKAIFLVTDGFSNGGDPAPAATALRSQGVLVFAVGVSSGNERQLKTLASSPSNEHVYLLDSFAEFEAMARRALHQDLKSGEFQNVPQNECNKLCDSKKENCCSAEAKCMCGTGTGLYTCLCPPGYSGSGINKICTPCPSGYWSDGSTAECQKCPDSHHITIPPAQSINDCFCKTGFRRNTPLSCKEIKCPRLTPPKNGKFLKRSGCAKNIHINATCQIKCRVGFELQGSKIRHCRPDGSWSGKETFCQALSCPPLASPAHGTMSCSRRDKKIQTECRFACRQGFALVGSRSRTCLPSTNWDGRNTSCKPIMCSALAPLVHGKVVPESCITKRQLHGAECRYECSPGFTLDPKAASSRICIKGRWSHREASPARCILANTGPIIECPDEVVASTSPGKSYSPILLDLLVRPLTNPVAAQWTWPNRPLEEILNSGGPEPPFPAPIGSTSVTFEVWDFYNRRASCTFNITVLDLEPPAVERCESPPPFLLGPQDNASLSWDPPLFKDNSELPIEISQQPNTTFFPFGETPVRYEVRDHAGNVNNCTVFINVQEDKCAPPLWTPKHGSAECQDGRCSYVCEEGYAWALPPPVLSASECLEGEFPAPVGWYDEPPPDCTLSVPVNTISHPGNITADLDSTTEEICGRLSQVEESVAEALAVRLLEACGGDFTCELADVASLCEDLISDYEEISNRVERIRRDQNASRKRKNSKRRLRVKFNLIEKNRRGIKRRLKIREKIMRSGIALTQPSTWKLEERLPKLSLAISEEPNAITCPSGAGFVAPDRCVICPPGSRWLPLDGGICEWCAPGFYQPNEGRDFCISCPINHFTRKHAASLLSQCKAICPSGWYGYKKSRNRHMINSPAISPCRPCEINYFQSKSGQFSCNPCPINTTASRRGSTVCDSIDEIKNAACKLKPCKNEGICIPSGKLFFKCECAPGWKGRFCEIKKSSCLSAPCFNGATCEDRDNGDSYFCKCPQGYTGELCEHDIDECASSPCLHGGSCIDHVNSFECLCSDGFQGSICDQEVDECSVTGGNGPCLHNGRCVDLVGGYRCECPVGCSGAHCELEPSQTCLEEEPCFNEALCQEFSNKNGSYTCECKEGFSGLHCEIPPDPCLSSPCGDLSTCLRDDNDLKSFHCVCPAGRGGSLCESIFSDDFILNFIGPVTTNNYISLSAPKENLNEITACFWLRTQDRLNYGTIFSYATFLEDNVFTLTDYNGFVLYVNGKRTITDVTASDGAWRLICVTWRSKGGIWAIYIDGRVGDSGEGLASDTFIPANGSLILGQEQDRPGGGFSAVEAFIGELTRVNMWSQVLNSSTIMQIWKKCNISDHGNIFSWPQVLEGLHGDIQITNSTFCKGCPSILNPNLEVELIPESEENELQVYKARIKCQTGFVIGLGPGIWSESIERYCGKQGQWLGPNIGPCLRRSCPFPGYLPRGRVRPNRHAFNFGDSVNYACQSPFTLHGPSKRLCNADGTWSFHQPRCLGNITCLTPIQPSNGSWIPDPNQELFFPSMSNEKAEYGSKLIYKCNSGFRLPNNHTGEIICGNNGSWSPSAINFCQPVSCPMPSLVNHGIIINDKASWVYGDILTWKCEEGYLWKSLEPSTIYCESDSLWRPQLNYSDQLCFPIGCNRSPEIPENSQIIEQSKNFSYPAGTVVSVTCIKGYNLYGSSTRKCLPGGIWLNKKDNTSCVPVRCSLTKLKKQIGLNGIIEPDLEYILFNKTLKIRCLPEFELKTNLSKSIQSDLLMDWYCSLEGLLEPSNLTNLDKQIDIRCDLTPTTTTSTTTTTTPTSTTSSSTTVSTSTISLTASSTTTTTIPFTTTSKPLTKKLECPPPPVPEHAETFGNISTYVELRCTHGYLLVGGSGHLVCQQNGQWENANLAYCQPVPCPFPPHYSLMTVETSTTAFFYGAQVIYRCRAGYIAFGDLGSKCLASGRWSRVRGKCFPISCGKPIINNGAIVEGRSYLFQDKVQIKCPKGTRPEKYNDLECLSNGRWSGEAVCVPELS